MSNLVSRELEKIISTGSLKGITLSEEKAFDFLICSLYCHKTLDYDKNWYEIMNENITDSSNDGGIDFVYFDEDNSKVIVGQNKYSTNIDINTCVAEIEKLDNTLQNFQKNSTSNYSKDLKKRLLNILDRLNDENIGNIDYVFASLSTFDESKVIKRVEEKSQYSDLIFFNKYEIEKTIENLQSELAVVSEFKFDLDETRNILRYSSEKYEGIVLNFSASSLKKAYDRYESQGLFNLNIRRYIKSKNVDDAIIASITNSKDDFWFKNNGLTIACKDFHIDGNVIKIYDFSIVNGGQTTTLIAKNFKTDSENFYVMCKIIKSNFELDNHDSTTFFNEIAEATNSQKPIQPRDLKANAPEMLQLQRLFEDRGYFLEIKRGMSVPKKYSDKKIKNDDLAQIYYSFVSQKPGTARSSKRSLFSNNSHYRQIFFQKYSKNPENVDFLIDLIELNKRIDIIIQKYKNNTARNKLSIEELNVLSNGKLAIIALMGFIYRISNNDYNIKSDERDLIDEKFEFGYFLSNYKGDNVDKLLEDLIYELVQHISEIYSSEYDAAKVTSISNFLKTDKKYRETILEKYIIELNKRNNYQELINYYGPLFRRNN